MTTRKKYSKESKLDVLSLVADQRYSHVEAHAFPGNGIRPEIGN